MDCMGQKGGEGPPSQLTRRVLVIIIMPSICFKGHCALISISLLGGNRWTSRDIQQHLVANGQSTPGSERV